jgi:hypothetical protein
MIISKLSSVLASERIGGDKVTRVYEGLHTFNRAVGKLRFNMYFLFLFPN